MSDFYLDAVMNQSRFSSTEHSIPPLTQYRFRYFLSFSVFKKLARIASTADPNNMPTRFDEKEHLKLILSITSDANEQYYLLRFFYKCLQLVDTNRQKYTDEHEKQVIELRKQGKTIKEIKEITGIRSNSFICMVLKKHGLSETVQKRKVTFVEKERIRELREQGKSISEIARELDRPVSTVYYVLKR